MKCSKRLRNSVIIIGILKNQQKSVKTSKAIEIEKKQADSINYILLKNYK